MDVEKVCSYIASQLRAERLRNGYSQEKMAKLSNISLRTYKRFEQTGLGSVSNLILSLNTLNRIKAVELLFPQPVKKRFTYIDRVEQIGIEQKQKT